MVLVVGEKGVEVGASLTCGDTDANSGATVKASCIVRIPAIPNPAQVTKFRFWSSTSGTDRSPLIFAGYLFFDDLNQAGQTIILKGRKRTVL